MGNVDRKLGKVTSAVLKRVGDAMAHTSWEPEFQLHVLETGLRFWEKGLYNLPDGFQEWLGRRFPNNSSVSKVLEVTSHRIRHNLPVGYIPPHLGYQSIQAHRLP